MIRVIRGSYLSLPFPSLIHLVEDVAPQSGVLGLLAEASLVLLDVLWVDQTCLCCLRHILELLAVSDFSSTWFGAALAIRGAVVNARGGAVCKTDFVFLGNLAVDLLHRECIFNLCHFMFGNGLHCKRLCRFARLCHCYVAAITHAPRASPRHSRHHRCSAAVSSMPSEGVKG